MGHHRARARSKHVAQPPPKRRPLAHHTRVAIACLAVIAIAVPAAAVASQSAGPTTHHSARSGSQHHARAHHAYAWWLHAWRWHRHHTGHGHSGPIVPNPPETSVPTYPSPSTSDPSTSDPSTSDPTSPSPSTTSPSTTSPSTTSPTDPGGTGQIVLGADGDAEQLANEISHPLARHFYRDFSQDVPEGDMLTVGTSLTWRQVAAMQPGSKIYQDVVRWAKVLGARGGSPLLSFSHEPEQSSRSKLGGANDFIQAFRKVVTVMRANGATNVQYTWHMTGWSFRANPSSPMAASKWYPGDAYVDVVGPDEYNWYTCGEGTGKWIALSDLVAPALSFAKDHGKKLAIPEFASYTDGRRTSWIQDAHRYLDANSDTIVAAFYFQFHPTNPDNQDCVWALNKDSEYDAFAAMAQDGDFKN